MAEVAVREVKGLRFEERDLRGKVPDLARGGEFGEIPLVRRIDPIFGTGVRFVSGAKIQPDSKADVTELTSPGGFCPFCPGSHEKYTVPFPSEMVPEGKIRRNLALAVPNIIAYSTYSAVAVYDSTRHFVPMEEFEPGLLHDAFSAVLQHVRDVRAYDHLACYSSINANYLPPSGSSLIHPHLQASNDYVPLTAQSVLIERARRHRKEGWGSLLGDYVDAERDGARYVGRIGDVEFLAPFAPSGFREVWAVLGGAADIVDLADEHVVALTDGLARILGAYVEWNLGSFNFALTGGGADAEALGLNPLFRIVARSNPEPWYRSDVTYFERLYGELMVDITPEETAAGLRERF